MRNFPSSYTCIIFRKIDIRCLPPYCFPVTKWYVEAITFHIQNIILSILTEHTTCTECPVRLQIHDCIVRNKAKLSVCLTDWALCHENVWGSGRINPRILDLGTRWRSGVSFTARSFYPRWKSPRYIYICVCVCMSVCECVNERHYD
jgi:hypothetical protein